MDQLLQAFILGNAAILTNVCILPLYPGMVAFLAGTASNGAVTRAAAWLGWMVLAGILTLMLALGALLFLLQQSFGTVLPVILPIIYAVVIVMGVFMALGRNPFRQLATAQTPIARNPLLTAYLYGILLGPMTLPCAGPLVVSAFLLGAGSAGQLLSSLTYFLAFGFGFGWPLVLIPMLAHPFQQQITRWTTRYYGVLTRASGVLLIAIGLFGIGLDLLPNL
ncbi:MAG: hypothetical protein H3C34_26830 [Caldilineaceae bacterium]|nr:hypothetical protein [Caldilineaceae bacterium]